MGGCTSGWVDVYMERRLNGLAVGRDGWLLFSRIRTPRDGYIRELMDGWTSRGS